MGNLQVRFLEGWAPAMAPGYSTIEDRADFSGNGGNRKSVESTPKRARELLTRNATNRGLRTRLSNFSHGLSAPV
jgi:hypothetical protein